MAEFRTTPPGSQQEDNSSGSKDMINSYLDSLKDDPGAALAVLEQAQERGIPPRLVAPAIGVSSEDLQEFMQARQQAQQQAQQQADMTQDSHNAETVESEPAMTPQKLIGFVDELSELVGEETSLAELKDMAEDNPDIVQTAIDLKL